MGAANLTGMAHISCKRDTINNREWFRYVER